MPSIKDTFDKLKKTVINTDTDATDKKLDQAIKDISSYRTKNSSKSYIDLIKNLMSKEAGKNINSLGSQSGIFTQSAISPAAFGQNKRLMRYKAYESIVYNISYCYRALNVLTDNILSPDDITKISLEVNPASQLEDSTLTSSKTENVKQIIKKLRIEESLNLIVKNTLAYGDFFCEISDSKDALTSRSLILESESRVELGIETIKETIKLDEDKKATVNINIDYSTFIEKEEDSSEKGKDISEISLVFHEPSRVVKLQSEMFPVCFGYLIFPRSVIDPNLSIEDQAVNTICASILTNLKGKIPQASELNDIGDLKDIIKGMMDKTNLQKAMEIRYVPPERMEHFMIPSTRYFPYGESIFDVCKYDAKVLIALETALAIQRLSRSTEKRKIEVELGLPRDAKQVIEEMKEMFNKRKISLDSFGTIDTIASQITTFEDVYIPKKDGKTFVDISTFNEGNVDIRSKVDELKFMRDSLVASLGVPASFLNIEENLSNKAALGEENILFARTIIGHQKYLTHQISKLVEKIVSILDPEEAITILENVIVAFAPPKSLQFEREARYIGEISNLIRSLEEIGIPREYAKKKYLTSIDWEELKKYDIEQKIDKTMNTGTSKEEEGFGGGGGMGGF